MLEIEAKVRIPDAREARQRLLKLGAVVHRERFFETNTLYDFPSGELAQKHQALRLRFIGKRAFLTFKGSPHPSRRFKVRDEYETELRNGKQAQKILRALGLKPVFVYHKYRTVFLAGKLKISLDEMSVGAFLEFEGPRHAIISFVKKMGLTGKNLIPLDYVQILKQAGIP